MIELPAISFEADQTSGVISVIVSGDKLSDEFLTGAQEASVALVISDGNNSITSNYIPLVAPKNELYSIAFLKEFNPDSVIEDIIIEVNNNNIELAKLAIRNCDGVIVNGDNVPQELIDYAKSLSKPVQLKCSEEEYAAACNDFYDKVMG